MIREVSHVCIPDKNRYPISITEDHVRRIHNVRCSKLKF